MRANFSMTASRRRLGAPGDGVLIDVVRDGLAGGFFDFFGGGEIGKTLGKIYGVVLHGEARHFADDGFGELFGLGGEHAAGEVGHVGFGGRHFGIVTKRKRRERLLPRRTQRARRSIRKAREENGFTTEDAEEPQRAQRRVGTERERIYRRDWMGGAEGAGDGKQIEVVKKRPPPPPRKQLRRACGRRALQGAISAIGRLGAGQVWEWRRRLWIWGFRRRGRDTCRRCAGRSGRTRGFR